MIIFPKKLKKMRGDCPKKNIQQGYQTAYLGVGLQLVEKICLIFLTWESSVNLHSRDSPAPV